MQRPLGAGEDGTRLARRVTDGEDQIEVVGQITVDVVRGVMGMSMPGSSITRMAIG